LMELQKGISHRKNQCLVGKKFEVLVEGLDQEERKQRVDFEPRLLRLMVAFS